MNRFQAFWLRSKPNFAFWGCLLVVLGLFYSRALISVGSGLIFLHPFLNDGFSPPLRGTFRNRVSLVWVLFFLLVVGSIVYTDDKQRYLYELRTKLPYLLFSVGLYQWRPSIKEFVRLLALFIISATVIGAGTLGNYLLHYDEINQSLIHSKPIPIVNGKSHIYFGVLYAFAILGGGLLLAEGYLKKILWRRLIIGLTAFNLINIHLVVARTGLLAFYIGLVCLAALYIIRSRSYLIGMASVLLAFLVLWGAVAWVPALQNRWETTVRDLSQLQKQGFGVNHESISMRFEAAYVGWQVFRQNPIIGCGMGDLPAEVEAQYIRNQTGLFPSLRKLPHVQYLIVLAGTGLIGFLLFVTALFIPFLKARNWQGGFFIAFMAVVLSSFMAEALLERQIGLNFFLLFWFILPGVRRI